MFKKETKEQTISSVISDIYRSHNQDIFIDFLINFRSWWDSDLLIPHKPLQI